MIAFVFVILRNNTAAAVATIGALLVRALVPSKIVRPRATPDEIARVKGAVIVGLTALWVLLAIAAWRTLFVGGSHPSLDGSFDCPESPWKTFREPLGSLLEPSGFDPAPFCNKDARTLVFGWSLAFLIGSVVFVVAIILLIRSRRPRPT